MANQHGLPLHVTPVAHRRVVAAPRTRTKAPSAMVVMCAALLVTVVVLAVAAVNFELGQMAAERHAGTPTAGLVVDFRPTPAPATEPACRNLSDLVGSGKVACTGGTNAANAVLDGDPETFWVGRSLKMTFSPPLGIRQAALDVFGPFVKLIVVNGSIRLEGVEGRVALPAGELRTIELRADGPAGLVPDGIRDLLIW